MWIPFLLFGAFLLAVTHKKAPPPGPVIGVRPPRVTAGRGAVAEFEFGAPYAVDASMGPLSPAEVRRLVQVLSVGTYHAKSIVITPGSPRSAVRFQFVAPKTEKAPIGQPLNLDLGDARARLVLHRVVRLA